MTRDFVIDRRAAGELLSTLLDSGDHPALGMNVSDYIVFVHPMGTDVYTDMYNEWTLDLLVPVAGPDTEIAVRHLPGLPETPETRSECVALEGPVRAHSGCVRSAT